MVDVENSGLAHVPLTCVLLGIAIRDDISDAGRFELSGHVTVGLALAATALTLQGSAAATVRTTVYARGPAHGAAFALDPQGRLWVAAAGLNTRRGDGVYVVRRAGGRAVRVIAGLVTPLGLAWRKGTLYVASMGRVDAFSAFDGHRFTHHRLVLRGPIARGLNGGLVFRRDGTLLMGVTASCDHCTPTSRFSGSIVSFHADGSDLRVFARRVRAAFGLAIAPSTGALLATMNQRDDLGARTPGDWVGKVTAGSDWGFPACWGQGGRVCVGVAKPVAVLDPHAAAGGLAFVDGGREAVVAEWQTGKVLLIQLADGRLASLALHIVNPLAVLAIGAQTVLVSDWKTGRIYRLTNVS